MDDFLNIADIAKTLGGLIAFGVVFYIGVLFYKKNASFSGEYELLLDQYRERNEELEGEIEALRTKHDLEIVQLYQQIDSLKLQVAALRDLLLQKK